MGSWGERGQEEVRGVERGEADVQMSLYEKRINKKVHKGIFNIFLISMMKLYSESLDTVDIFSQLEFAIHFWV